MAKASFSRHPLAIAMGVVALHVGGLAALQSGLLVRAYELVVPVEMISQIIEPPQPIAPAPPPPAPAQTEVAKSKSISPPPAPQPLAITDPSPAPNAPIGSLAAPAPLPPISAPVAIAPSPAAAPAPALAPAPAPKVELPRADADYLNNPKPPYPPVSKRMGEQGRVVVRVYVGEDGQPQKAELRTSSGFDRLDATAVATVMRWRFRPGMRGASPEAMWVNVPIDFTLDN
jgi:periplasmic protein TonB